MHFPEDAYRRFCVPLRFRDATLEDVAGIAGLQNAAAGALTARFGPGHWSSLVNERGAALAQRHARVRIGRDGIGSLALEDARTIAQEWPADVIRLDAYDAKAGAGGFYARCGFTERGRVVYKGGSTGLLRTPASVGEIRQMRPVRNLPPRRNNLEAVTCVP